MFDLREHGFTDCIIHDDMHDLSNNLPHWNKIPRTNIKYTDGKIWEYLKSPLKDVSGNLYLPALQWEQKLDEGTYGKVYLAQRKIYNSIGSDLSGGRLNFGSTNNKTLQVVVKESPIHLTPEELKASHHTRERIMNEEAKALIHEAAVMTLAHIAVKKAGLEHTVPRVYEIFCHIKPNSQSISDLNSICISMEYIHGNTLLKYMRAHFKRETVAENDIMFLNFVSQMATILSILQTTLRMNHRDIKINNILLRDRSLNNPVIVLIDYGFACIANGVQEPHEEMPKIEAGAFFGSRYACFKHGRDMCQFLYSLHCYFPYDKYLSPQLLELVKPWMMVKYKYGMANLLDGITSDGYAVEEKGTSLIFDEGIYYFLRRPEVDPLQCSPQRIMDDIAQYNSTLQDTASKIEAIAGNQPNS